MSFADIPADTDAQRILIALDKIWTRLDEQAHAINGLGQNQQWVVDNVQDFFKMLHSPAIANMIPNMLSGVKLDNLEQFLDEGMKGNDGPDAS